MFANFVCCPLTSTLEIHREEVFEVFNTISFLFDTQEKPFSFEVVKYFMGKITERVLAKLQGELASLKAEALNPVSIRASQVCVCARTFLELVTSSCIKIFFILFKLELIKVTWSYSSPRLLTMAPLQVY